MTCPYCNNVMEEGIIQSPQELSWKKESNDRHSGEPDSIKIH